MKTFINQRFIDSINYLIGSKVEIKKAAIGIKLNLKPAKFSEILNSRMNLGIDTAAIFCSVYDISFEWLLTGQGTMLKPIDITRCSVLEKKLDNATDYIIALQKDKIEIQEEELKK